MHVNTVKAVLTAKVFQGMKVEMFNSEAFSPQIKGNIRYFVGYLPIVSILCTHFAIYLILCSSVKNC